MLFMIVNDCCVSTLWKVIVFGCGLTAFNGFQRFSTATKPQFSFNRPQFWCLGSHKSFQQCLNGFLSGSTTSNIQKVKIVGFGNFWFERRINHNDFDHFLDLFVHSQKQVYLPMKGNLSGGMTCLNGN